MSSGIIKLEISPMGVAITVNVLAKKKRRFIVEKQICAAYNTLNF